jgi:hypothetical protein
MQQRLGILGRDYGRKAMRIHRGDRNVSRLGISRSPTG